MKQEDMQRFVQAREGQSEDALMEELGAMTRQQRAAGELSDTKMEEIYRLLSPVLTEKQRQKMQQVISRLKE